MPTLYADDDDALIHTEQFVRLVCQSLRDAGYTYANSPIQPPSMLTFSPQPVRCHPRGRVRLRHGVATGLPVQALHPHRPLGKGRDPPPLSLSRQPRPPLRKPPSSFSVHTLLLTLSQDARFLISQQKYLELLEARKTTAALHVLRNELAPINTETEHLHTLSRSFQPFSCLAFPCSLDQLPHVLRSPTTTPAVRLGRCFRLLQSTATRRPPMSVQFLSKALI